MQKYFQILRECALFDGIEDGSLIGMLGCFDAKIKTLAYMY